MKTVYLAGPISGLKYDDCVNWREDAVVWLKHRGIHGLSPMRAKEYLKEEFGDVVFTSNGDEYKHLNVMSTSRGIMTRDRFDAMRCDVLLVNLLGTPKVSIGTMMEVAWADSIRTPIVVIMEEQGNIHEHSMLAEATGFRVDTMQEALHVVANILGVS